MSETTTHSERHVSASRTGFEDLNAALAWVVQTHDREFAGSQMVKLVVEQYETTSGDLDDTWHRVWTAAVSGMTEVEET